MDTVIENDSLNEALDLLDEIREMERCDDADYRRLITSIGRRRRRKTIIKWSAVAAALIGFIILIPAREKREIDHLVHNTLPYLELPDGKQVTLGVNPQDETIADETDVSVTVDCGTLRYAKKADAAEPMFNTLYVPRGSRPCDILLEDGTYVWLNAGSTLRFPSVFPEGEHRVFLEGEAFFEVSGDVDKPFAVVSGNHCAKVLGTRFNISAYADDPQIVTTLVEGSVEVSCGGDGVTLIAGRQAALDRDNGTFAVRETETDDYTAWKEGVINMEKRTLAQIVQTLSRLYDVEIVFADSRSENILYRGSIPRYDRLTDVLKIIEAGSPVGFSVSNNAIYVRYIDK